MYRAAISLLTLNLCKKTILLLEKYVQNIGNLSEIKQDRFV